MIERSGLSRHRTLPPLLCCVKFLIPKSSSCCWIVWTRVVWPDHTGYQIAQGWIEPDVSPTFAVGSCESCVSVSWPDQRRDQKYFLGSPAIAVEILSPGKEIDRKLTLYSAEGALEVWVIDAKRKAITVYAKHDDAVIRRVVDREFRSEAA